MRHAIICCAALLSLVFATALRAADEAEVLQPQPTTALPEQDDSTLRDVTFSSPRQAWAVGDRGVLWSSTDAGSSWQFLAFPAKFQTTAFTRVRFLTDRVGWISGKSVTEAGGIAGGVLLWTTDGGATWTPRNREPLPPLNDAQFFDLEQGVAVGAPTARFPTGVIRTTDGGVTWTPCASAESREWLAAAFFSPDQGLCVGPNGGFASIARETLLPGGDGLRGLRGLHALTRDGWLAGDGALLMRTNNQGVSWQAPSGRLPRDVADYTDFRTIASHQQQVWAAGSPGSVVWHSANAGQTWEPQPTGSGVPLTSLAFADSQNGIAVGALGRICITRDGGETWRSARNGSLRLAALAVTVNPARLPLLFATRWSREDGYRIASLQAVTARHDATQALNGGLLRQQQSLLWSGASVSERDWRLPLSTPGLQFQKSLLNQEWSQLFDRKFEDVLLRSITAQLRAWQPSAILLEEPVENDFATLMIQQAWTAAVKCAADPSQFPEIAQQSSLRPWQVEKILLQRAPGRQGTVSQDPREILIHQGTTLDAALASSRRRLGADGETWNEPREYVTTVRSRNDLSDRTLLNDLNLPIGSAARRALAAVSDVEFEKLAQQARHRRQIDGIAKSLTVQSGSGDQLLAQMSDVLRSLTPAQAAQQLLELATLYQTRGNWAAAEDAMRELSTRFPEQPAGAEALLWLTTYTSSAELNWQRLRAYNSTGTTNQARQVSAEGLSLQLEQSIQSARNALQKGGELGVGDAISSGSETSRGDAGIAVGDLRSVVSANGQGASPQQQKLALWQTQGADALAKLQRFHPQIADAPGTQFIAAAAARRRNQVRRADEIYQNHFQAFGKSPWQLAARGEIYLMRPGAQSPKPVVQCRTVSSPPLLDGMLSDDCWKVATEIPLSQVQLGEDFVGTRSATRKFDGDAAAIAIVMLARDQEYLYVAASLPIDSRLPTDSPELPGRTHDADVQRFDRLQLQLDIDRDYATTYVFEVDQRGMTRDSLWNNPGYNPQWFCAVVRDEASWRLECAIPIAELAPADSLTQQFWGLGLSRVMPGVGVQGWTDSGGEAMNPALFGLLRF